MRAKIAVIIPARYGSTRFPGKALHPIAGKPLVQHVWERCTRARGIDTVIIATDDTRIADAATGFGARVEMTSAKHRSGTDRIAEVVKRIADVRIVVNVQGDEPLIDPALITRIARTLATDPKVEMATAASLFDANADPSNPHAVKVVTDRSGNALYFSRSPIPFVRDHSRPTSDAASVHRLHHGIYGFRRDFLLRFVKWKPGRLEQLEQLEQLRALENGASIRVLATKSAAPGGVDTPADVGRVERSLAARIT